MPPGGEAMRSATSRWTISTKRSGRGSSSSTWCSTGLVMWYGRLATSSQGSRHEPVHGRVEEVALDQPRGRRSPAKRSRRCRRSRGSTSTAVTCGAGPQQRRRQDADARPDLQHVPPGPAPGRPRRCAPAPRRRRGGSGSALVGAAGRGAAGSAPPVPAPRWAGSSSVSGSGPARHRQPRASVTRTRRSRVRRGAGADQLVADAASLNDGRARGPGRRARRPRTGAEAGGADHGRVVGAQSRTRHDQRDAERPQHRPRSASRSTRVGRHAAAHDDGPGTVPSRPPGGSWWRARRRPNPGTPRRARRPHPGGRLEPSGSAARPGRRASAAVDGAPRGGLEAAEAEVERYRPARRAGNGGRGGSPCGRGRHDGRAARDRAGPASGRPCRRPRPAASSTV